MFDFWNPFWKHIIIKGKKDKQIVACEKKISFKKALEIIAFFHHFLFQNQHLEGKHCQEIALIDKIKGGYLKLFLHLQFLNN